MLLPKVDTEPIYEFGGWERTVNKGALIACKQINRLSTYIQEKVGSNPDPSTRQSLPDAPAPEPSWFDRLKTKTSKIYKASSKAFSVVADPIIQGGKKLNTKLCDRIDRSDHNILHSIKNFAARSENSIKNAFYTVRYQTPQDFEQKKPQVNDTTLEPINMHIEQTTPLTEIKGRDDKLPVPDPLHNYHTLSE